MTTIEPTQTLSTRLGVAVLDIVQEYHKKRKPVPTLELIKELARRYPNDDLVDYVFTDGSKFDRDILDKDYAKGLEHVELISFNFIDRNNIDLGDISHEVLVFNKLFADDGPSFMIENGDNVPIGRMRYVDTAEDLSETWFDHLISSECGQYVLRTQS